MNPKQKTVLKLLDESEEIWRNVTKKRFPLFSDIKVDKTPSPLKKMSDSIWEFYIDEKGDTMHTLIFKPKEVYNYFENDILNLYHNLSSTNKEKSIEDLLLDTLVYLHFHELGHPLDAPYSKDDWKKIKNALYEGILEAMPNNGNKEADALRKASNARNMALDMIDDDTFYSRLNRNIASDSLEDVIENEFMQRSNKKTLEDGIITTFDVIGIKRSKKIRPTKRSQEEKNMSAVFSLSRIPYAMLFVNNEEIRAEEYELFEEYTIKMGLTKEDVEKRAKSIFNLMILEQDEDELKRIGIDQQKYLTSVDAMFNNINNNANYLPAKKVVEKTIYLLFNDKKTRYNAIKGYIKPFADLLAVTKSCQRGLPGGVGDAIDASDMLDDILDSMDENEANELLQQLINETDGNQNNSHQNSNGSQKKALNEKAIFEFYKRNAKEIEILSPKTEFQTNDLGKEKHVEKVSSVTINIEDLANLDFNEIRELQEEFGYENPIFVDLTPNKPPAEKIYELNTYEWVEDNIKINTKIATGIEVPDNFVLAVDSSGSMGGTNYVGSGTSYDILCRVVYGLFEGLKDASSMIGKNPNVKIINFSDQTISSQFMNIDKAYNPGTNVMHVLHSPQNRKTGFSVDEISKTENEKKKGKTVYAFITDGGFNRGSFQNASFAANYLKGLAEKEGNSLVYIEIGSKTELGEKLSSLENRTDSIHYYQVNSVDEISSKLEHILIEYKR